MSKRAPFTYGAEAPGQKHWRSLGEFAESPEFQKALEDEFPEGATEMIDPVSRRSFIGLMGASLGLAGLSGCRRPEEKILPYNKRPENVIPGKPVYFATVMPFAGTGLGLLVESHQGRPTKIEGNPDHPESRGGTNTFAQASVLDLYDVARSKWPREKGAQRKWTAAQAFLKARGKAAGDKGGEGLAILVEAHRSPTLQAQLRKVTTQWPAAKVYTYDPLSQESLLEGARMAFGRRLQPVWDLSKAQVVVTLDADPFIFEGSPVRQAREFIDGRRVTKPGEQMNRLYAVESAYTVTGAKADHRLRLASRDIPAFAHALAHELATKHDLALGMELAAPKAALEGAALKWVKTLAGELAKNRGAGLVVAGAGQPAFVHALCDLVNAGLGNVGATLRFVAPFAKETDGAEQLKALVDSMQAGKVETLLVLGGNPVYSAPGDVDFAGALGKVATTIHLSGHYDETSEKATWHLNRAHYLESWSDVRAPDGTLAAVQPLIAPLFDGRTDAEVVSALLGEPKKAYELVREAWAQLAPGGVDSVWQKALHDGVVPNSALAQESVTSAPAGVAEALAAYAPSRDGYEITFHPDMHTWDGRHATNGWLMELPDNLTKLTWGNAAWVSPALAKKEGLADGDYVELTPKGGRPVKVPALIQPGQADDSIALFVGQGRRKVGELDATDLYTKVGENVGADVMPARTVAGFYLASAGLKKTGATEVMARTQEHHTMEGRPLAREATLVQLGANPDVVKKMVVVPTYEGKQFNLYGEFEEHKYDGHKWGMAIDLTACIGCNACMVACQSENNVPLVGKDGVVRGREMHWLRIDRYFSGDDVAEPSAVFQPIACVHCENAPCELVCPVAATTHSAEGLNDMAYNRCVGTRYCANNCPYKVRRFNYFNYAKDVPELRRMGFNPDVTVRARGVMEKCSYCVQRIQQGKIAAKREQREKVRDGEVVSACAQACPTNAIAFGDLNDPTAKVTTLSNAAQSYKLLEEINTRPRTTFLAQIRNPNPELEG